MKNTISHEQQNWTFQTDDRMIKYIMIAYHNYNILKKIYLENSIQQDLKYMGEFINQAIDMSKIHKKKHICCINEINIISECYYEIINKLINQVRNDTRFITIPETEIDIIGYIDSKLVYYSKEQNKLIGTKFSSILKDMLLINHNNINNERIYLIIEYMQEMKADYLYMILIDYIL